MRCASSQKDCRPQHCKASCTPSITEQSRGTLTTARCRWSRQRVVPLDRPTSTGCPRRSGARRRRCRGQSPTQALVRCGHGRTPARRGRLDLHGRSGRSDCVVAAGRVPVPRMPRQRALGPPAQPATRAGDAVRQRALVPPAGAAQALTISACPSPTRQRPSAGRHLVSVAVWHGVGRERLTTRVDPTSAALLRLRAPAAGMTTSDYMAGLAAREVTHQ